MIPDLPVLPVPRVKAASAAPPDLLDPRATVGRSVPLVLSVPKAKRAQPALLDRKATPVPLVLKVLAGHAENLELQVPPVPLVPKVTRAIPVLKAHAARAVRPDPLLT